MAEHFNSIMVLMAVAVVCVWSFRRLSLPPILAYIFAVILAGPSLMEIGEPEAMDFLAELGIVFLLFTLGLEFSLPRMFAMRTLVFGVGLSQTILTHYLYGIIHVTRTIMANGFCGWCYGGDVINGYCDQTSS